MNKTIESIRKLLEGLRCHEPHGTGLCSCRCTTNDTLYNLECLLIKLEGEILYQETNE